MHSIKITAFSCFLLCSYASYSSAPARFFIHSDELEVPEIPLVSKRAARDELNQATINLQDFFKNSRYEDLVKKLNQAQCARKKHWASFKNAQGNEVQRYEALLKEEDQEWNNLVSQAQYCSDELWIILGFDARKKNIFFAQAILLRAEKEELIKEKEAIRNQNQQKAAQLQQKDAEINQLRAALQRQAPAAQPIADASHQTPPPPYAP